MNIKKLIYSILKITWVIIGIILAVTLLFFFVQTKIFNGSGFEGLVGAMALITLFVISLIAFLIFIVITLLFILIKLLVKKCKKKKFLKREKLQKK